MDLTAELVAHIMCLVVECSVRCALHRGHLSSSRINNCLSQSLQVKCEQEKAETGFLLKLSSTVGSRHTGHSQHAADVDSF